MVPEVKKNYVSCNSHPGNDESKKMMKNPSPHGRLVPESKSKRNKKKLIRKSINERKSPEKYYRTRKIHEKAYTTTKM